MLQQLLVLPTSGPIPRVLGCGSTSHFRELKIPITLPKIIGYWAVHKFILNVNSEMFSVSMIQDLQIVNTFNTQRV